MYESRIASGRLTVAAVEGYEMADLLFVRSRSAARMLAQAWGEELVPTPATAAILPCRTIDG
ncbi:hypothetical protein [uncultured Erythrobacter sp.]|uniref:hypothetical protein n=1 Tax=uncultured Erythrobacter sp. TaxID=263913 RepID=UPI00265B267E|nr:hypothetical protein [uncultured Erythrobacter sp.]